MRAWALSSCELWVLRGRCRGDWNCEDYPMTEINLPEEHRHPGVRVHDLTDRIASLIPSWMEWELATSVGDDQFRILGVMVWGKEVSDESVADFAKVINYLVDTKLFHKRRLAPVVALQLPPSRDEQEPPRWVLFLYGYSNYSREWLNEVLGWPMVVEEGAMPWPNGWPPFVRVGHLEKQLEAVRDLVR